MRNKFFITCDEATSICDKNQYGEAKLIEKIKLSYHLILCKFCNKYTKQNTKLSEIFSRYVEMKSTTDEAQNCLEKEEIQEMKKELELLLKKDINS